MSNRLYAKKPVKDLDVMDLAYLAAASGYFAPNEER